MDAKTLFDEKLPALLRDHPERGRALRAIYGFELAGEGGGAWTVDLRAGPPCVRAGSAAGADCTIQMAADDFRAMLEQPQLVLQLFSDGRLRVTGDLALAAQLHLLFQGEGAR